MTATPDSSELKYFIAEKGSLAVVVFAGSLSRGALPILEQCKNELVAKKPAQVILNLRDIQDRFELPAFAGFTGLQTTVRGLPAKLQLCGLHPELGKILDGRGLIRSSEVSNNLEDALQRLLSDVNRPGK